MCPALTLQTQHSFMTEIQTHTQYTITTMSHFENASCWIHCLVESKDHEPMYFLHVAITRIQFFAVIRLLNSIL